MTVPTVLTLCTVVLTLLCLQINAQPRNHGLSQRGSMFHRGIRPIVLQANRRSHQSTSLGSSRGFPAAVGSAQSLGVFRPRSRGPTMQTQYFPRPSGPRRNLNPGNRRRFQNGRQGFALPMTQRQNTQTVGRFPGDPRLSSNNAQPNGANKQNSRDINIIQRNIVVLNGQKNNSRSIQEARRLADQYLHPLVNPNGAHNRQRGSETHRGAPRALPSHQGSPGGRGVLRSSSLRHGGTGHRVAPSRTGGGNFNNGVAEQRGLLPHAGVSGSRTGAATGRMPSRRTSHRADPIGRGVPSSTIGGTHSSAHQMPHAGGKMQTAPQMSQAGGKTHGPHQISSTAGKTQGSHQIPHTSGKTQSSHHIPSTAGGKPQGSTGKAAAGPAPAKTQPSKHSSKPSSHAAPTAKSGKGGSSKSGAKLQSTKKSILSHLSNANGMIHIDDLLQMTQQLLKATGQTKQSGAATKKAPSTKGKSKKGKGKGGKGAKAIKKPKKPKSKQQKMKEAIEMIRGSSMNDILSSAMRNPGQPLKEFLARAPPSLAHLPNQTLGENKLLKGIENLVANVGPAGLSVDLLEKLGLLNSAAVISTGNVEQDRMISDLLKEVKKNVVEEAIESLAKGKQLIPKAVPPKAKQNQILLDMLILG